MTKDRSLQASEVGLSALAHPAPVAAALEAPWERLGHLGFELLGAKAAFAVLLAGDRYVLAWCHGLPESCRAGGALPLLQGFCEAVVAAGTPLAVADGRHEHGLTDQELDLSGGAYVGVPLALRDGSVAGVFVVTADAPRPWAPRDLALLQELAELFVDEVELRSQMLASRRQSEEAHLALLTELAHEFRTPLTSIKGFVELILDGEVGQISEQQREFLAIVARNAERLINLVNDRIASSRGDEVVVGAGCSSSSAASSQPSTPLQ